MTKIKNIEAAAERIKQAVKNKERIILYGDSDCDGICSVVILQEAIKNIGGEVALAAFPNREEDGYGINPKALELVKGMAPALFITLDLGIGNVKEVAMANEMGFEVLIVDHHQILEELPPAKIIVDPRQPGDESGATYLCNAGLTFKLAQEMLGSDMSQTTTNSLLELVALATIADMMPQVEENVTFIREGLGSLHTTFRPGLRAFLDILGAGQAAEGNYQKVIGAINAAESVDFTNESYDLLVNHDAAQCRELVENLLGKIRAKQQRIREITEEVERRIANPPAGGSDSPIIFEGDPAWKLVLAGPVASNIAVKHEKPTFIYKKGDRESCGSIRSLKPGQNSVDAMKSCAHLLITYGGHPKASGFRAKTENLEEFKACLIEYFKKHQA